LRGAGLERLNLQRVDLERQLLHRSLRRCRVTGAGGKGC
jgi:hypothetical protein